MDSPTEPQQEKQSDAPVDDWTYVPNESDQAMPVPSPGPVEAVEWTASEFVHHDKSPMWFVSLGAGSILLAGLMYLVVEETVTVVVVLVMAALFGIMANRKPQTLTYKIDDRGITIGAKSFPFANFRSFSVIDDEAIAFIQLMPVSRVSPVIKMYYPPDQEGEVIDTLGDYLPHEDRERDSVDRLMSKIRF